MRGASACFLSVFGDLVEWPSASGSAGSHFVAGHVATT